jgi:hypothetical protein
LIFTSSISYNCLVTKQPTMEPPPSYEESAKPALPARNGISPADRRSMEDEHRPLPEGWVRQYDSESQHQFFVDTTAKPPRSIWHHPYDDETYLETLDPADRDHALSLKRTVTLRDITAESSDDEPDTKGKLRKPSRTPEPSTGPSNPPDRNQRVPLPPREEKPSGFAKLGRKFKDRLTDTTHAEREREREQRALAEQQAYAAHRAFRQAMSRAIETGQPQHLGKDRDGKDVFVEPPNGPAVPRGPQGYGYNPYAQGPYMNPNARFVRPDYPYNRPYGYGYGGGYGVPIAAGFLGGALLGGLLF